MSKTPSSRPSQQDFPSEFPDQNGDSPQRRPTSNLTKSFDLGSSRPRNKTGEVTKSALHMAVKDLKATENQNMSTISQQNPVEDANVLVKYTVSWVNKAENNKVYQIIIELSYLELVTEAIRDIIPYFNEKLAQENSQFALSTNPGHFDLYKAKKTGFPKLDYPGLDNSQVLSQTGINRLNLTEKSPEGVIVKDKSNNSMVENKMPGNGNNAKISELEDWSSIKTTTVTCCWCIKFKKRVKFSDEGHRRESELGRRLLQDEI